MTKTCHTCKQEKRADRTKDSEFGWRKERNTFYSNCRACVNKRARIRHNNNNAKAKKRRTARKESEAIERDPHGHLAVDIIIQAIADKKKYQNFGGDIRNKWDHSTMMAAARRAGYGNPVDEVDAFFASDWFEELCDTANVNAEAYRRHLGLEE